MRRRLYTSTAENARRASNGGVVPMFSPLMGLLLLRTFSPSARRVAGGWRVHGAAPALRLTYPESCRQVPLLKVGYTVRLPASDVIFTVKRDLDHGTDSKSVDNYVHPKC